MALPALVLILAAVTVPPVSAVYPELQLPSFALSDLQAQGTVTLQGVGDAIAKLGLFAVTGFQDDVAHEALSHFVSCAVRSDVALRQVKLDDGARRSTLAATTNGGVPLPLPGDARSSCPDFAAAAHNLRAAVAATGSAYAAVLDNLLYGSTACATADQCFTDAVRTAESLEHFHLFEPSASSQSEQMLAMHSDIGLFLVMSPAELFDRAVASSAADAPTGTATAMAAADDSSSVVTAAAAVGLISSKPRRAHDLVVQLADGQIVAPVIPDGALLVMNGEGLTRWMRAPPPGSLQPYSPLHEVLSSDMRGGVRAWFGRMFMPPPSARLQVDHSNHSPDAGSAAAEGGMTFRDYRQHTYTMFRDGQGHEASAAGCSPTRRLLVDEGSCGTDQVYCWHSCMPISGNLTCGKSNILCANLKNTSLVWPQDYTNPTTGAVGHCMACGLVCPAQPVPRSSSSFCNTNLGATTMWMTGFQFAKGHEDDPCVVYLFPEWVLDTPGKLGGACIGTFCLGVLIGLLGRARNWLKTRWEAQGCWMPGYRPLWRVWMADAAIIAIIAVQVCFGYFLMLVAMTYQAELFMMVVLGLAAGHVFYRPSPTAAIIGGKDGPPPCRRSYALQEPCCACEAVEP